MVQNPWTFAIGLMLICYFSRFFYQGFEALGQGRGQGLDPQGPKSRTFDSASIYHATNTKHLRGQVWLGFYASMLYSYRGAQVSIK